jgi:predicted aspartyl protease
MRPRVHFDHEFNYRELEQDSFFPVLDVTLIGPQGEDELIAIVDTGATYCLFSGVRAPAIGIELLSGRRVTLSGLAGQMTAWIHSVELEILGTRFQCEVAFSEQPIPRELLGRHSLFNQVRLGFREGFSVGFFHPAA